MNVLIYSGEGASVCAVRQARECLRRVLSSKYSVSIISAQQIIEEPWMSYTAMLVMPGGADLPSCRALNGVGNQRIRDYVLKGGRYLGICAGAYYACSRIEFEKNTPMEVSGTRELGFYDGVGAGVVFKGFQYETNWGAKAVKLHSEKLGDTVSYYNGGCLFEGDDSAEVLARYVGPTEIESSQEDPVAVIYKTVGKGKVILSGVHFEYEMDKPVRTDTDLKPEVIHEISAVVESRHKFVSTLLSQYMQLEVSDLDTRIPKLTPLYLCSLAGWRPSVNQYMNQINTLVEKNDEGQLLLKEKNDTFLYLKKDSLYLGDTNEEPKPVYVYNEEGTYPSVQDTPYFNFGVYFAELEQTARNKGLVHKTLGSCVLYGEVVTSTSSMLERNLNLLRHIPDGLITVGTQQVQGRGRGNNVWVNPIGVLAVSGVIRLKQNECPHSLVFVQYLISLSIVKAVNSFLPNGTDIGIRLKWPNDIYILKQNNVREKTGGVIVSCNLYTNEYVLVFGAGTNVDNDKPTTSINTRLRELNIDLRIQSEQLLGRFMPYLDSMLQTFQMKGFAPFESEYYKYWLHSGAKVILERYSNVSATIKGLSPDSGMLIAQDGNGVKYELQPDGNSFDMLRGLIRRKL